MLSVRLVRLLQSPFILFTILMIFKSSLAWNSIFGEISLGTVWNDHTLFIPGAGYEDGRFYSLRGGEAQELGALSQSEYQRALKLLQLSDSYIRQLPDLPE